MANVDVHNLKLRCCALEKEALAALSPTVAAFAYPRWFAKSEKFPYFINRIAAIRAEEGTDDYGEEMALLAYTVTTRLVVAHITAEYRGEVNEAIDEYLPQVIEYMDARELLQSVAYPLSMPYLIRASFSDGVGFNLFPPSLGGVSQVGADFNFRCEFVKSLTQAYEG